MIKEKLNNIFKILKDKGLEAIKFSGIAFLISFLGAFAGSEGTSKNYRRIGIPVVFIVCAIFQCLFSDWPLSFWIFTIALQHLILRLGWGIPDTITKDYINKPAIYKPDEGSLLGRFWYKIFKGKLFLVNCFTRGTIGLMLALSFIGCPMITGNWFEFIYCSLGIVLGFALIAWRNLGEYTFTIKGKKYYCCKSDVIVFGILGLLGLKIIF